MIDFHLFFNYFILTSFSIFSEIAVIGKIPNHEKKKIPDLGPGPDQIPDLVLDPKARETKGGQEKKKIQFFFLYDFLSASF